MSLHERIEEKLRAVLSPDHLEIVNESSSHNVPPGAQTHFRVVVASGAFEGLGRVARHQKVFAILDRELGDGVHALSIQAYSSREWARHPVAPQESPRCLGGSKEPGGSTP